MNRSALRLLPAAYLLAAVAGTALLLGGAAPQQPAAPPSVKPGINDSWKSPNIAPLVEMLEAESREIYRERRNLAALVGPAPGAAIADVGAGSGFMVELFAGLVGPAGRVYAVDINPKLLERIARRSREQGLNNVQSVLAREDSAELPPNAVDLVFLCDTYHHFEHPEGTMASIHRALRPGGQLVVVDFQRLPGVSRAWVLDHVRAGQDGVAREIIEAGFELTNVHAVPWLKENYVLRFRKAAKPQAGAPPAPRQEARSQFVTCGEMLASRIERKCFDHSACPGSSA